MISRREFMGLLAVLAALPACETMGQIGAAGAQVAASAGMISQDQADEIGSGAKQAAASFEDFTPEQEYYIGRSVGAIILQKYKPYANQAANAYVNTLGQTLAAASDYPQTYRGYHFLLLDSEDINALAAPGGLIFVTRGMVNCCTNEDELSAVLAHEVGHVSRKHGLQAIQTSRITSALTTLGLAGAKAMGGEELAALTETFEDSLKDITSTLINNGYSRASELEADESAVIVMKRVGYQRAALVAMLENMETRLTPGGADFAKTHPDPKDRIAELQRVIGMTAMGRSPKPRTARFESFLKEMA